MPKLKEGKKTVYLYLDRYKLLRGLTAVLSWRDFSTAGW